MDGNMFRGLGTFIVIGLVAIPIAIWKLVEIVLWLFHHVSVRFS